MTFWRWMWRKVVVPNEEIWLAILRKELERRGLKSSSNVYSTGGRP